MIAEFSCAVSKFGDTLNSMRKHFGKKSLKLTTLGSEYIPNWNLHQEQAHSALFDVWATTQIIKIERIKFSKTDFKSTYQLAPNNEIGKTIIKQEQDQFSELISFGIITKSETEQILEGGSTVFSLKQASLQNEKELGDLLGAVYSQSAEQLERKIKKIRAFFRQ